jgi:hypothetical protein
MGIGKAEDSVFLLCLHDKLMEANPDPNTNATSDHPTPGLYGCDHEKFFIDSIKGDLGKKFPSTLSVEVQVTSITL